MSALIIDPTGWEDPLIDRCEYSSGYKYQLRRAIAARTSLRPPKPIHTPYVRLDPDGWMVLRAGYAWNGASGPTIDTPSTIRASAFHDAAYALMSLGLLSEEWRPVADEDLKRMCAADGMWIARAGAWEIAVNVFGARNARSPAKVWIAPAPAYRGPLILAAA